MITLGPCYLRFVILNGDGSPGSGVPGTSPFIHRDTNFFSLEDLKSDTEYEIDLYIIPIPKSKKEYISEKSQVFRTEKPELGAMSSKALFLMELTFLQGLTLIISTLFSRSVSVHGPSESWTSEWKFTRACLVRNPESTPEIC